MIEEGNWKELELWNIDGEVFEKRYKETSENLEKEKVEEKQEEKSGKTEQDVGASGLSFGFCSLQGKRDENEDSHLIEENWRENLALFGVFDGHGGDEASAYVAKKLPKFLNGEWNTESIEESFKNAFVALDKKYLDKVSKNKKIFGMTFNEYERLMMTARQC